MFSSPLPPPTITQDYNNNEQQSSTVATTHPQQKKEASSLSSTSSDSPLISFLLSLWDRVTTLTLSLHHKEPIEDWKVAGLVLLFNVYMLLSSLFLPTMTMSNEIGSFPSSSDTTSNSTSTTTALSSIIQSGGSYSWGFFGGWIFNILNMGASLSIDRLPYIAVVVISFVFVALLILCSMLIMIAYRFMLHSDSMYGKTKLVAQFLLGIIMVCALFMTFVMSSFLDCTYDFSGNSNHTLVRFGIDYSCFSLNNIIYFVFNILGTVLLLFLLIIAMFVLSNTHPLSKGFFIATDAVMPTTFWVVTCLELALVSLIPQQLGFVRAIIHILCSLLLTFTAFKSLPFYRALENSILFGVCCGKLGASTCSLIASLVNSSNEWKLGIGMSMLTICVMGIGFVVGVIVLQIYQSMIMRTVRNVLIQSVVESHNAQSAEKETLLLYQTFEDRKIIHYLGIFLQLGIGSKTVTQEYSDVEIAVSFIRGIVQNKSFSNVDIMITGATLMCYYSGDDANGPLLGMKVLSNANKNRPTFTQQILIKRKSAEIETHLDTEDSKNKKNMLELRQVLEKLEKYHQDLNHLHRSFWKEMMSDVVNTEKIEEINRSIATNTSECEITYENLMQSYGNERRLLRLFAYFLENFKFDKETSQAMMSEALTIEEEEVKTKKRTQQVKQNKVVPIKEYNSLVKDSSQYGGSANDLASQMDGFSKLETSSNLGFRNDTTSELGLLDDMALDGIENNAQAKKEFLFRASLSVSEPHSVQKFGLLVFIGLSAFLVVTSIALSVSLSIFATKDISNVKDSCSPLGGSSLLLSEFRTTQAFMNVVVNSTQQTFFSDHKLRLKTYSQSLQVLIDKEKTSTKSEYQNYVSGRYEILIPSLPESGVSSSYPIYTKSVAQNATIFDIVHMIDKHEQILAAYSMDQYNQSLESFSLMFLMLNRDRAENAFQDFCIKSATIVQQNALTYADANMIFLICAGVIYALFGIVIIGFSRFELSTTQQLIKLMEKDISKNIIGKIFHHLGKRGEDEIAFRNQSSGIRPANKIVLIGLSLLLLTLVSVVLVSVGAILNGRYAASTIQSVSGITKTLLLLQKIQSRLVELFMFNKMDQITPINDPRLSSPSTIYNMYQEIHPLLENLMQTWSGQVLELTKLPASLQYMSYLSESTSTATTTTTASSSGSNGLNYWISDFVVRSEQLAEKLQSNSFNYDSQSIFFSYLDCFLTSTTATSKIATFLTFFINLTTQPDMVLVVIFSIVGCIQLVVFGYLLFGSYSSFWRNSHQLRLMLNYIPWEILDANEKLRNYVLHHDLSNGKSWFRSNKIKDDSSGAADEDTKAKNILNSAVDGTILCSQNGEISIFNPSAQKMFGIKANEAEGLSVYTLFDPVDVTNLKTTMETMCKCLIDNENGKKESNGETIEIECFRKNQTKFPSRINIFATMFGRNPVVTFFVKDITSEKKQSALLAEEKKKSESLLLNILPEAVAIRLKSGETYIAEKFKDISCFFSDMVGFTKLSSNMEPIELVKMLSQIVNGFDSLTDKYGIEKIKTIGDAYFCVGGLHNNATSDHPERLLRFSIDVMTVIHNYNVEQIKEIHNNPEIKKRMFANLQVGEDQSLENRQLNIRVGINSGPVVAGVIGSKKFAYDLWGDTINMASRMESTSLPGRIQISRTTYERVHDIGFDFEEKRVEVKGKGSSQTYLLNNEHHAPSTLTIEEIEQLVGNNLETLIEQAADDPFEKIDLHRVDNYGFAKLIQNYEFIGALKDFLTDSKLDIVTFYQFGMTYKMTSNVAERFKMAQMLVTTYLDEQAPNRLKFKFMKNAFGPFQLKYNNCNETSCSVDLFDNFMNLSSKSMKPELPMFFKSKSFATFLEKIRKDPPALFKLLRVGKDGSSTTDSAEEEDEKEFILFCEKCGTEIINLENHRFNDWEFDHRLEGLKEFTNWRVFNESDSSGKTYLSPEVDHNHLSSSRRHTQIKYHYEMDCSAEALFNLWIDPDYFKCREVTIDSANLIDFVKVGKYAHAIYHEILKMSFPHQDRELVHAYCCRKDAEEKRFLCASRSINNPKITESSLLSRAEIKTAFMVEEVSAEKCRYTYTIIYDPMGLLNADHYFTTFKDSPDVYHHNLTKLVIERGLKKSHKKPETGGLVQSLNYSMEMRKPKGIVDP